MKKILSLVLIVLLIMMSGCNKQSGQNEVEFPVFDENNKVPSDDVENSMIQDKDEIEAPVKNEPSFNGSNINVGTPISFEGLSVEPRGSANYIPIEHLADIQESYSLDQAIVFRGVLEGLHTPIEVYRKAMNGYSPDYCETNLRVLEVFYGNIQVGDIITHKEWVRVIKKETSTKLETIDGYPPIKENEEYIFILFDSQKNSSAGKKFYEGVSAHYYFNKVSDYGTYKTKVQNGTASTRENFGYEVLDYYLNQPQTKLDLREEALKYVENIPEDATEEEILQALSEDKKELFDRMIKQYGTK